MGLTVAMREVCLLLAPGDVILWADTSDSPLALHDSRERWERIWTHRHELVEIVHSHPGGPAAFSTEDITTMSAIDAALGRSLRYAIVTPNAVVRRDPAGRIAVDDEEPWWTTLLRVASGILP